MSPFDIGVLGVLILLLLMFCKMPIGYAMGLIGCIGFALIVSFPAAIGMMGITIYSSATSYTFSVIPLFVLMGQLAFRSKTSEALYASVYKWVGSFPGGLATATIGGCACFSAVTGSSVATAVTMGSVALPEMRKYKYDTRLALGAIASGGTLGILIPPSIAFVIYGILTEQPIGKLLLAGILPGITLSLSYVIVIYIIAKIKPELAPRGPRVPFKEKVASLKGTWPIMILFLAVMGGLYSGVATPTEAAAIGAGGAFIFALYRRVSFKDISESFYETGKFAAMIFMVLSGSMIFNVFLARSKIPFVLSDVIIGAGLSKYTILIVILLLYLLLGCIMESYSMIVLTVPSLIPLVTRLGFDPIWFGVIVVIMIEMGMITPPIGLNVFIIRNLAKDVSIYGIFLGTFPFVLAMIFCVILLIVFPEIALIIPNSGFG